MTFDLALFNSTHLVLEIDPANQTQAWQQSQSFATPQSQWNAYLNQLCLQTLLPWLQAEREPDAAAYPSGIALNSIWEVVNGTAIALGQQRLVLVPSEAIDMDELRVPQEWMDIPDWVADYYLAVQVNADDQWLRVVGCSSHRQLKEQGGYDWSDRTYSLDTTDLIADLNVLWVSRQLVVDEPTQATINPLPALPTVQAQHLIQRLGDPSLLLPRLAVPFETWASLIQHGGWRQQLADQRRGIPEQQSVLQWLQTGVSTLAQQVGWGEVTFQPSEVGARGVAEAMRPVGLCRRLRIGGQFYEMRLLLLRGMDIRVCRFELRNMATGGRIPAGFKLKLLTEDLQPFADNEDIAATAVEVLYVEVALDPGEGIVWEVEPKPQGYDREILRF